MKIKLNIFDFDDYRTYLTEAYNLLKSENTFFSFRYFAGKAGFASGGFLKLVMGGKRNLTHESVEKISKALGLSKVESDYFENLVKFNQAPTSEEKSRYFEKMSSNRGYKSAKPIDKTMLKYYSKWYIPAIREMISMDGFVDDPRSIAHSLMPNISEKEASEALDILFSLGLIEKKNDGKIVQTEKNISSGSAVRSLFLTNFHKEMIEKGKGALDTFEASERDISSLTFATSQEDVQVLKEKIKQFRQELMAFLDSKPVEKNRLFQINFQLFPLTKKRGNI